MTKEQLIQYIKESSVICFSYYLNKELVLTAHVRWDKLLYLHNDEDRIETDQFNFNISDVCDVEIVGEDGLYRFKYNRWIYKR